MKNFKRLFSGFVTNALKVIMLVIVIGAILLAKYLKFPINMATLIQVLFLGISGIIFYKLIKSKKFNSRNVLLYVLAIGFILRLLWLLNANTVPVSDFKTMYNSGIDVLNGDFKSLHGSGYIARFPHLTMMVLYFAFMIKTFSNSILVIKMINLILSVLTIYLIYKICKEVFEKEKYALTGAFIAAIFPPMISYIGVFCTENIAIPFYLGSIYLFIKFIKKEKGLWILALSGILLSLGNLFRMVAAVTLVAYIMYIFIYYGDKVLNKIKASIVIIASFAIILLGTSFSLRATGITEFQLWRGSEPAITNVLKGINIEHNGRWNEEDAAIPELCNYDYEKMEKMSKEIIMKRLTTTPPLDLFKFYVKKFGAQWSNGDLEGVFWTIISKEDRKMIVDLENGNIPIMPTFQWIYVVIMLLAYLSLFNRKRIKNETINLFYIIFCGYGLSYLVTESQGRYAYIVNWLFIIFAVSGIEKIKTLKR